MNKVTYKYMINKSYKLKDEQRDGRGQFATPLSPFKKLSYSTFFFG